MTATERMQQMRKGEFLSLRNCPAGEEIQIHNVQTYNFKWEVLHVLIFIISKRIFDSIGGSETTNNK